MNSELEQEGSGSVSRAGDIDRYVGSRLRQRRATMGLTQKQLARLCGITYQQVHKYETGINRISAGRLHEFSLFLDVGVAWFFEGLRHPVNAEEQPESRRMMLLFMQNVFSIEYDEHLQALNRMAQVLSERSAEEASN